MIERMSGSFSWSAESVVTMIWTSLRMPFGKSGRSGRSVRRAVRMPAVLGRPSRRKKPPGILPAAYSRSSKSMVRGKKSMPSRGSALMHGGDQDYRVAVADRYRSVRETGHLAGFERHWAAANLKFKCF